MLAALITLVLPLPNYVPTPEDLAAGYRRGDELRTWARQHSYNLALTPTWLDGGKFFWYRSELADQKRAYWVVDTATGQKSPLFDKGKLQTALERESKQKVDPETFSFRELTVSANRDELSFSLLGSRWKWVNSTSTLTRLGDALPEAEVAVEHHEEEDPHRIFPAPPPSPFALVQQGGQGPRTESVDKFRFALREGKVVISDQSGKEVLTSTEEGYSRPTWSPKGRYLMAWKLIPGDRRQVHLVVSSPTNGGRAVLRSRNYDLPGDKLDTHQLVMFDAVGKTEKVIPIDPIMGGGQPWAGAPGINWHEDGLGYVNAPERGYQRYRVYQLDPAAGNFKALVDESSKTFFDTTNVRLNLLNKTNEFIWRSERDGFGHFYLMDRATGAVKNQITKGPWVTRDILWVNEDDREICFTANGREPGIDPYFIHAYVVKFDGSGLRRLTDGNGTHTLVFAPDRKTFVDTWSRIDAAPVHELRRTSDGKLLTKLEEADVSEVKARNVKFPEPFVAKGRDGKTDIYGIVCWPTNFDPKKKYPVIENIYAGPHDSHVPKSFFPYLRMQRLSELGFIVVQIDGMGTRNRGKAFHDVAWQNIADGGFPDRIAWMKALNAKHPSVDIERVGVFGTSAGGQNSTAAVLFHPEFYKVAVSSCGCHDNRMDKMWWNEQWMGYPVGPHYEKQSNITNAANLKGDLMLIVGELDTNVPPESTYRLVDALVRANKDFEFVMIPNADHTDGGEYGERQRKDFFVKKLFGVDPPRWGAF